MFLPHQRSSSDVFSVSIPTSCLCSSHPVLLSAPLDEDEESAESVADGEGHREVQHRRRKPPEIKGEDISVGGFPAAPFLNHDLDPSVSTRQEAMALYGFMVDGSVAEASNLHLPLIASHCTIFVRMMGSCLMNGELRLTFRMLESPLRSSRMSSVGFQQTTCLLTR